MRDCWIVISTEDLEEKKGFVYFQKLPQCRIKIVLGDDTKKKKMIAELS